MLHYRWPGNVRELQNVVEYAMNMESSSRVCMDSLSDRIKGQHRTYNVLEEMEKDLIVKALAKYGWSDEAKALADQQFIEK